MAGGAGVNAVGVTGTTVMPAADLSIVKSASFDSATGVMTYTLLVSNAGPDAADGASYADAIPGSITGINASCAGEINAATCADPDVTGNDVTGNIPTLPATGSVTITITGTVAGGTPGESNTATVSPPNGVTDPNADDNSSTANTTTPVTLQSFEVN
jgi:uncharacterized repeat protein (TIGR01451 family)